MILYDKTNRDTILTKVGIHTVDLKVTHGSRLLLVTAASIAMPGSIMNSLC